jgi:hypothetical protein
MSKRYALILIARYREAWLKLSPAQQRDFLSRVSETAQHLGLESIVGYQLTSTPGTFMALWEAADRASIERAIKNLNAIGFTQYVDARTMIGERGAEDEP